MPISPNWLQGGAEENVYKLSRRTHFVKRTSIMTYYNIEDLVIGESMDPLYPSVMALGDNVITATISQLTAFKKRIGNQLRRFGRQSQVKENKENGQS